MPGFSRRSRYPLVDFFQCFPRRILPRELSCLIQSSDLQGSPKGLISQHPLHRPRQGAPIGGVHQKRRVPRHLGQDGGTGADDGRPAGHRLQHRQAEALVEAGEDEEPI